MLVIVAASIERNRCRNYSEYVHAPEWNVVEVRVFGTLCIKQFLLQQIVSNRCNSVYLGAYHPGFEGKRHKIQACEEVFYNDR